MDLQFIFELMEGQCANLTENRTTISITSYWKVDLTLPKVMEIIDWLVHVVFSHLTRKCNGISICVRLKAILSRITLKIPFHPDVSADSAKLAQYTQY